MATKPYYISEEGLAELEAELEHLRTVKRREIAERIKEAKALGDLSENAEYQEAKEAQAANEGRIAELEDLIRRAVVIKKRGGLERVWIGSTVEVKSGAKRRTFTIVGSEESDPDKGFISNESPLGQAFLGKKVGDEIEIETPAGKVKYKILAIK
jgi:transcription elongation factor GreA